MPNYDLDKIKYATDGPTWEKAVGLYQKGKVTEFKELLNGFSAVVLGSSPYQVFISSKNYDRGDCECYLGQNDTLCKHMVAVAICAVKNEQTLTEEEKKQHNQVICSGKIGQLGEMELVEIKKSINLSLRYIKSYSGPSRTWFAYQDSLTEGCNRLATIVSKLPVNIETSKIVMDLLLRLDKKLCEGGVDDSDGTTGGFMEETVVLLGQFAKVEPSCIKTFKILLDKKTCFGWEEPLVKIIDEGLYG